ncbi:hypothetical protein GCM10010967_01730 [Dyadobacter beijingensis]|uniref:Outer membrane protein beta-barrel domain-containing protein n=1 Tax=Dyadobacter beijingensis TaxID=365489 RepID=A0ABQ2HCM0_9BACT|nr:hypothetical protein [Dyadobacter beijingensis]GGM73765.1 hypothetical protein GCM10010967_01730 [Dyadobacter beijingensis]
MIELPDDELDKLFRKSSEELDPTYEPDDWNDLRKRLDQQDGRTPAGWWRKWWPLGILALLIPAGIALYSWYGSKEAAVGKVTVGVKDSGETEEGGRGALRNAIPDSSGVVGEPAVAGKEAVGQEPGVAGKAAVVREPREHAEKIGEKAGTAEVAAVGAEPVAEKIKNADTKKEIGNKLKASEKEAGKSSSISDLNAASAKSSKTLPRSRSKAGGVYLEPIRSKVEGGDGAFSFKTNKNASGNERPLPQTTSQEPVSAGEPLTTAGEQGRTLISASALSSEGLKWNALQLPGIFAPVQIAPLEEPEETRPSKQSNRSADDKPLVAFRFGYSPDLSTVGLKNFSKPGTAVSLLAEYSFLPRFYLQSGAVWSRKDYYAAADAYELPKIPHYYPPEMTGVDGICNVLEVPLNLRYDVAQGERSRWFASGGFSSYHMNSERYKYYFVNENDPNIKYRGWKGNTGWYLFSHANVSAGYEYRISRKLSLLAEPSIRVPLKRVGYGKVNLITTGLWLSVRYTPVFK